MVSVYIIVLSVLTILHVSAIFFRLLLSVPINGKSAFMQPYISSLVMELTKDLDEVDKRLERS